MHPWVVWGRGTKGYNRVQRDGLHWAAHFGLLGGVPPMEAQVGGKVVFQFEGARAVGALKRAFVAVDRSQVAFEVVATRKRFATAVHVAEIENVVFVRGFVLGDAVLVTKGL